MVEQLKVKQTYRSRILKKGCEATMTIHNCPQNAIHLTKEANTVRFRNEHITLADIIKANG